MNAELVRALKSLVEELALALDARHEHEQYQFDCHACDVLVAAGMVINEDEGEPLMFEPTKPNAIQFSHVPLIDVVWRLGRSKRRLREENQHLLQQLASWESAARACCCGDRLTMGTVHRLDGPCWVPTHIDGEGRSDG